MSSNTNEGCLIIDHIVPNSIAEPDVRGSHLKLQVQLTLLHCVIENLNSVFKSVNFFCQFCCTISMGGGGSIQIFQNQETSEVDHVTT